MPSFRTQFNKIENAYLNHTFDPMSSSHGFWGTIFNNDDRWNCLVAVKIEGDSIRQAYKDGTVEYLQGHEANQALFALALSVALHHCGGIYRVEDIVAVEKNFMTKYLVGDETEDALYEALTTSLDMLREMHKALGRKGYIPEITLNRRANASFDNEINDMLKGANVDPILPESPKESPE